MQKNIETFKRNRPLIFDLLIGLITALLFSAFIYLEDFGITIKLLNTIFGLASLGLFLYIPKKAVLTAGFLIGLLWFYWIGYSFEYNGVGYMTPIITFSFAIIYMLFFGILALTDKVYIRAVLLFGLSFFEPFDWNWLQIELLFVDSYIGVFKYQLLLLLVAMSLPSYIKEAYRYTPLILILLAINFNPTNQKEAPLKIKLAPTDITQDKKWLRESQASTIAKIFKDIEDASNKEYEVIIFPESVFPLYMNKNQTLINQLLILS
ncbi:MAG: apolipoprotein N-acyltransferase, partial [Campylobacterota bacterium]|nr:apolipoprotein N-acyltransferase [Campylobacterota bacterium]